MKKKLFILIICMFTAMSAQAANWLNLETKSPNLKLFIDTDSINYVSKNICYYSIMFKKGNEISQVAYIKANKATNEMGVLFTGDFSEKTYNPNYYLTYGRAFLRPVRMNTFLAIAQNYAYSFSSQYVDVNNITKQKSNIDESKIVEINDYKTYTKIMKKEIFANWNPPKSSRNTEAEVVLSIADDGSLFGYKILNLTGNEDAKRAIIAAIEMAAPYKKLPRQTDLDEESINIKLIFDYKLVKKEIK